MKWSDWDPGMASDDELISDVLKSMPQSPIKSVPKVVKMIENPDSRFYLAGPASLRAHDLVHVILGRGLLAQDEAFVIGFTMGDALGAAAVDRLIFLNFSTVLYPKPFKFSAADELVFNFAFDCGLSWKSKDIHRMEVKKVEKMSMASARALFGLTRETLDKWYSYEANRLPSSRSSKRLTANFKVAVRPVAPDREIQGYKS